MLSRGKFFLVMMALLAMGAVGCGTSEEDCDAGEVCACGLYSGVCTRHCIGGGCNFRCDVTSGQCDLHCIEGGCTANIAVAGSSTVHCTGGDCDVKAGWSGNHVLKCPGNNCTMDCSGARNTGSCTIEGCTLGCKLTCNQGMACSSPCSDSSCSVDFK